MADVRATVRLQFHQGFTLDDAVPLVNYFARLGISHVYASPLLTARPGSGHGYDVVDPTRINPELGGEDALRRLVDALRAQRMGLILDIVPNHMAVGGDANPWWLDVLEWGTFSPYAVFFDIQWASNDPLMDGRLLVPFLRSDYGEVLAAGEVVLHFDHEDGTFHAQHFEHRFPISPPSYGDILRACGDSRLEELATRFDALRGVSSARHKAHALCRELARLGRPEAASEAIYAGLAHFRVTDEASLQRLHHLLEHQHYRMASWRTAADDLNWRRFFDINELGGLRVEIPEVFEATHGKIFELIEGGFIDGLRIDHVDGLANPRGYCRKLRRRVDRLMGNRPLSLAGDHFPIYVEKILGDGEQLPGDWGVDGTTGYEFMNQVSLLQHDPRGEPHLGALWQEISGRPADFREEVLEARRLVLSSSLASDLEAVSEGLLQIARTDIASRDLTLGAIRRTLVELVEHFPVYRTYAGALGRSSEDQRFFQQALDGARTTLAEADWPLLDYLGRWLGGQPLCAVAPAERHLRRTVLARFQQLTSPAAAKSVEDTACYRAGVLLSRYDVGFDPQHFSAPPSHFHQSCIERQQRFPGNLLATATHDHKRGEDNRARLAVLSERWAWFAERVRQWFEWAQPLRTPQADGVAPSPGDEMLLYQALLGSWPLQLDLEDAAAVDDYLQRVARWQEKALREAKLKTAWSAPNGEYEGACRAFLEALLTAPQAEALRRDIAAAAASIAPVGALNGLAQCLLRMGVPGIPDLYQGTAFWDFSLVDPDNRREVDFDSRIAAQVELPSKEDLIDRWQDGRIKQWLISQVLSVRYARPELFSQGQYLPLEVVGEQAERVLAFARLHGDDHLIVVVPRLAARLLDEVDTPHVPAQRWGDTRILLPEGIGEHCLTGIFSTRSLEPVARSLALAEVLADFPVNLLCSTQLARSNSDEHR